MDCAFAAYARLRRPYSTKDRRDELDVGGSAIAIETGNQPDVLQTTSVSLLADIKTVWPANVERLSAKDIIDRICAIELGPVFPSREFRETFGLFLDGLLSGIGRKTGWLMGVGP